MNLIKAMSMLGLAAKAGKIASGEFSVEKAVKNGKAFLVIVADDSSNNTKKMFRNMCSHHKVLLYFCSDKVSLGHAIGREQRASLAVTDEGFARTVERQLADSIQDGGSKHGK